MQPFDKVVRVGTEMTYGGRFYSIYCHVKYNEKGRLSISGVEGPLPSGNCLGACGQIDMHSWDIKTYAPGWYPDKVSNFRQTWKRWHLNDLRSTCEHQRARGETYRTHPGAQCPDCGYKLGTAWLFEPVPEHVLEWLYNLPDTDRQPAWI